MLWETPNLFHISIERGVSKFEGSPLTVDIFSLPILLSFPLLFISRSYCHTLSFICRLNVETMGGLME